MEWNVRIIKGRRIKVTLDGKYGMRPFGKWLTVTDLMNGNKIIRHCRSYGEVEELIESLSK